MRVAVLALLTACSTPGPPVPDATLHVLGHPVATRATTHEGAATVWTWQHPFVAGALTVIERAAFHDDGTLVDWARTRDDGTGRWLTVHPDGTATWRLAEGGVDRTGTWSLPARPHLPTGPWPADGPAWFWDGEALVSITVDSPIATASDGRTWRRDGETLHFPDGSRLGPPALDLDPYDPATTLSLPGPTVDAPRRARLLDATVGDTQLHVRRPLGPELPKVARPGPLPDPPRWTLPTSPNPIDLRITAADDRLLTVTRAFAVVRRLATDHGDPGLPDAARVLSAGGDCDDLSTLLVAGLAHEQVPAEIVRGWLLTDDARWVLHAWVRVPLAAPTPWLHLDPALGQLPADAARLPDHLLPPGTTPADLTDLVIR